jgi:uncharacterized protein (DUF433 family)
MPLNPHIQIDPKIRGGKPVVRGTTVLTTTLLGEWEKGLSMAEILALHPEVTEADVRAAIDFSLHFLAQQRQAEHYTGDR